MKVKRLKNNIAVWRVRRKNFKYVSYTYYKAKTFKNGRLMSKIRINKAKYNNYIRLYS